MTKVVYNSCFGGFSLSEAGIIRYAELKGLKVYPEKDKKFTMLTHYWTVPPEDRLPPLEGEDWYKASQEERIKHNEFYRASRIYSLDLERDDPVLVQVVEELGEKADGDCARLAIAEVPKGIPYRIDEYDGNESVCTKDDYEWKVA